MKSIDRHPPMTIGAGSIREPLKSLESVIQLEVPREPLFSTKLYRLCGKRTKKMIMPFSESTLALEQCLCRSNSAKKPGGNSSHMDKSQENKFTQLQVQRFYEFILHTFALICCKFVQRIMLLHCFDDLPFVLESFGTSHMTKVILT